MALGRIELLYALALSIVWTVQGESIVDSCMTLREALEDQRVTDISVRGSVICSPVKSWPTEIVLDRDIIIYGELFGEGKLSFPDITTLVLAPGHFLTFNNLLLLVHFLDEGITVSFVDVGDNSEVFMENSALISESCEGFGVSSTRNTIVDGDVGVLDSQGREIVHSCNTAHICSDSGEVTSNVIHSIQNANARSECEHGSFNIAASQLPSLESESINTLLITVLTSAIFGCIVVILIVILVFLIVQRRSEKPIIKTTGAEDSHDKYTSVNCGEFTKLDSHQSIRRSLDREARSVAGNDLLSLTNWNFKLSDIEIGEPLGRGSFGKVYKGNWQDTDVAVKCVIHGKSFLENRSEPLEAYLSRQVSHPNVVQTFIVHTVLAGNAAPIRNETLGESMTSDPMGRDSNRGSMSSDDVFDSMAKGPGEHDANTYETWIVLEYCDQGSLARAIRDGSFFIQDRTYTGPNVIHAILTSLDVARAMMYLHNVRIIHGDLKAANVLLKSDASDPRGFVCKVGDFGLSRFLANDTHIETFTCGTITHMPPELLKGGVLTPAADVYSFAILMWELLTGKSPYGKKTHAEIVLNVVNKQRRPCIPDYCPDGYAEILEDCWRQSHLERPGFPEIVDRLKELLDEETVNPIVETSDSGQHGPLIVRAKSTPSSLAPPSFHSCRPMSCEFGCVSEEEMYASNGSPLAS